MQHAHVLWRELLDVNYRMLSPNLPWSLSCCFLVSPRFFPGHPCFSCLNYFSHQFSASPVAFWCDANCTISAKIILWSLSWLWVISLLFFGPLTDFCHLVLCFIIKHPFSFNLRSVDRVVFHEAWWMWRLHKKGRWVLLGPGRIIIKVLYGEVVHRSPNTFIYHFCEKGTPFVYLLSTNSALSHT